MRTFFILLAAFVGITVSTSLMAQSPREFAVRLWITKKSPTANLLSWEKDANTTGYTVLRKPLTSAVWEQIAQPDSNATQIEITTEPAEYQVLRSFIPANMKTIPTDVNFDTVSAAVAAGYIATGYNAKIPEQRGTILLVIDSLVETRISSRIDRLVQDLKSEWWTVRRIRVSRTERFDKAAVAKTKAAISEVYDSELDNLKCIFLIGRVAVPYSGRMRPDGHPDHTGAWVADCYYGDMDGTWTDNNIRDTSGSRVVTRNIPGDGKFDQSSIPSNLEAAVGRVDFYDMPAFRDTTKHKTLFDSEIALLERYFDKNHAFRSGGSLTVPNRAVVDDNFGSYTPEMFGSSGWRLTSLTGKDSVRAGDILSDTKSNSYLWMYGCGPGSYTGCGGIGASLDFASQPINAVFTMLFGSYFGDWDITDNVMRSCIAAEGMTLTCAWSARPHWYFHRMGLGMTTGDAFLTTINSYNVYIPNAFYTKLYPNGLIYQIAQQGTHVSLIGDPSLRMAMGNIQGPSKLTITQPGTYTRLQWQPIDDASLGYAVYRTDSVGNTRILTSEPLWNVSSYNDSSVVRGNYRYAVRSVRLRTSPTGSYYDINGNAAEADFTVTGVEESAFTDGFTIECSPVPARTYAAFRLTLPCASTVMLDITDISGANVYHAEMYDAAAGERELLWDLHTPTGQRVTAGTYVVTVTGCGRTAAQKIVVLPQ